MKRKAFLGSGLTLGLSFASISKGVVEDRNEELKVAKVPYLKPGDTIGITSPAGFISIADLQSAIFKMESWGFKVKVGSTPGRKHFTFGGTDDERLADLQAMLDDADIHAVMCARGGYGCNRIIDRLNFSRFIKHPKWIIGFSDISVLHAHINSRFHIPTIHSKMCNSFPDDWSKADEKQIVTIDSIRRCLVGENLSYTAPFNPANRMGNVKGKLVGGNAITLLGLEGTKSELETKGKILFLEEVDEYPYAIDRFFITMKRNGKLAGLKALVLGGFRMKKETGNETFDARLEEIVMREVNEYSYPVCFDFPVGHQKNNMALRCGMEHELSVTTNGTLLTSL